MSFTHRLTAQAPAQATANGASDVVIGEVQMEATVTGVSILPDAAVTLDASHYRSFEVFNRGTTGAGTTSVATFNTSATSLVAGDEQAFTLSATAANLDLDAGDVLECVETITGNGVAHGGYTIQVEFTRDTNE